MLTFTLISLALAVSAIISYVYNDVISSAIRTKHVISSKIKTKAFVYAVIASACYVFIYYLVVIDLFRTKDLTGVISWMGINIALAFAMLVLDRLSNKPAHDKKQNL